MKLPKKSSEVEEVVITRAENEKIGNRGFMSRSYPIMNITKLNLKYERI